MFPTPASKRDFCNFIILFFENILCIVIQIEELQINYLTRIRKLIFQKKLIAFKERNYLLKQ